VIEADDGQPDLRSLAAGIRNDQQAVTNGPSLPCSSGKVEGTINKIKMIKRQMYGRAGFVLLRKRVILHPALPGSQNSRKSQNWWPPARRRQGHPNRNSWALDMAQHSPRRLLASRTYATRRGLVG